MSTDLATQDLAGVVEQVVVGGDLSKLSAKFWSHVIPEPNSGCWLWDGSLRDGYGLFRVESYGRVTNAHRVAYQLCVGPIPEGLILDHLCRMRQCVNPAHLEPVTNSENIARGETGITNRSKTRCPAGHPYTTVNSAGSRVCYPCSNTRMRRRRQLQKEAAA